MFLSGDSGAAYQVSTGGAVAINGVKNNVYGSAAVKAAMATLVQQSRTNLLENEYNRVTTRAVTAESQVTSALLANPATNPPFSSFPTNNPLADQLRMVARLIAARSALGATRQVFMVSIGGFDLHDNLIAQQPTLLTRVSEAMTAFYNATADAGRGRQGHRVHRVGFRAYAGLQRRRLRPRLGWPPSDGGRRGQRQRPSMARRPR